jgi:uncharacterized membrane protein
MDFTNRQILNKGLDALQGKWPIACGASCTIFLIVVGLNSFTQLVATPVAWCVAYIFSSVLNAMFFLGLNIFTLKIVKKEPVYFNDIFRGFNYYKRIIPLAILFCCLGFINILVIFTLLENQGWWSVVSFIWWAFYTIVMLMLSQVSFILIENPDMEVVNILTTSKYMMDCYKWKLFCLCFIFGVLGMLCIVTLGIGLIWAIPYMFTCSAQFYLELKQRYHPAS